MQKDSNLRQVVGKSRHRKHMQKRGNARREQLLDAVEILLKTTPVEELSFKLIAEKANIPEGSAYHFFANRYDLLSALARRIAKQFADEFNQKIDSNDVYSWHDLVNILVDRSVVRYRANPAASQIWLSGRTPAHVRLADHVSDRSVSGDIQAIFNRFFLLPDLPKNHDIFFYFMEICDVMLSLSMIENEEITEFMLEEAKRAGIGYLTAYLPLVLKRKDKLG